MKEIEYQVFLKKLYTYQDLKYRDFQSNLGIEKETLIGVRTPILKNIAKEIAKLDYLEFIKINSHNTYEERLIHGLILGYIHTDFNTLTKLFWEFLPYIDNWAICDLTVTNLHIWERHTKEGLKTVKRCLKSKNKWYQRVGFVLLLTYYIHADYIDFILDTCNQYKTEDYYVKMSIAWLLSICYIKEKEKTKNFLMNNQLNPWIQNKTIQKIRESKRITEEEREEVLKWKKQL